MTDDKTFDQTERTKSYTEPVKRGERHSPGQMQALILRIAAMDFCLTPLDVMRTELKCPTQYIYTQRNTDLYRQTLEELTAAFKQQMLKTPGTAELRKTINYGLSLAVKKLIRILAAQKSPNRDVIAAARLMAQMDGRFIGADAEEERKHLVDESVASELIQMVQRAKQSVQ